ncbi:hypothetical protein DFH09DRAFT_1098707 [Mycena vulgaris]|nr:hypothetical protein DFH09DRAFT_1098707 [Mycena vulgaris]
MLPRQNWTVRPLLHDTQRPSSSNLAVQLTSSRARDKYDLIFHQIFELLVGAFDPKLAYITNAKFLSELSCPKFLGSVNAVGELSFGQLEAFGQQMAACGLLFSYRGSGETYQWFTIGSMITAFGLPLARLGYYQAGAGRRTSSGRFFQAQMPMGRQIYTYTTHCLDLTPGPSLCFLSFAATFIASGLLHSRSLLSLRNFHSMDTPNLASLLLQLLAGNTQPLLAAAAAGQASQAPAANTPAVLVASSPQTLSPATIHPSPAPQPITTTQVQPYQSFSCMATVGGQPHLRTMNYLSLLKASRKEIVTI